MFENLRARGIEIVKITLHVGVGTFIPVRTEDPREHVLKPERFALTEESAARLNAARDAGRRMIAVGTTSTRTLEYVLRRHGRFVAASGEADLFILPGYEFKAVDGMLTNFHLPQIDADHAGLGIRFARKHSHRISPCDARAAIASTATAIACLSADALQVALAHHEFGT